MSINPRVLWRVLQSLASIVFHIALIANNVRRKGR